MSPHSLLLIFGLGLILEPGPEPVPVLDATVGRTLATVSEVGRYKLRRFGERQSLEIVTRRRSATGYLAVHCDESQPVESEINLGAHGIYNLRIRIQVLANGIWTRSSLRDDKQRTIQARSSIIYRVRVSKRDPKRDGYTSLGIYPWVGYAGENPMTDSARILFKLKRRTGSVDSVDRISAANGRS